MSTAAEDPGGWLVVGLGNPGPTYAGNRHNLGYLVLDVLADRMGVRLSRHKGGRFGRGGGLADVAEGRLVGQRVVLARPRSYMNESGGAVASVRSFYKVPLERIVVVHDELDIEFNRIKVKIGGGDAGHNGVRSVRRSLGSGDFVRVRLGVGRPTGRIDPADWVLRDFGPAERKEVPHLAEAGADAVEAVLTDGVEGAQRRFHGGGA